jgi:predicted CoA-binding protein
VTEAKQILEEANTVLVVDWPTRDVPTTLASAGYIVVAAEGPEPDNYSAYELRDEKIVVRHLGRPPERADLVYSYRPLDELPRIVTLAKQIGAQAVWCQSGLAGPGANDPKGCWMPQEASQEARKIVGAAGLRYIENVYIADAVRNLGIHK